MGRERERMSRQRAAAAAEAATREAANMAEQAKMEHERELLDEARKRVAVERSEVVGMRDALDRERAAFAQDVEALKQLGLTVQAESVAVREAMTKAESEMAEGRRLQALANEEREGVKKEHAAADAAMAEVIEGRKAFETERLATAKVTHPHLTLIHPPPLLSTPPNSNPQPDRRSASCSRTRRWRSLAQPRPRA